MSSLHLFNGLTFEEVEILDLIQEEAAEVIQAIAKVKRHGFFAATQDATYNNRRDLEKELGHFLLSISLLTNLNQISISRIDSHRAQKRIELENNPHYLHHVILPPI